MKKLIRISMTVCLVALGLWVVPSIFLVEIEPGQIGVRQSSFSGLHDEDLGPGWHWRIPGIHKVHVLPASYQFLDYTPDKAGPQKPLVIRTRDNNNVELDVSVPIRIKPGEANQLVGAGNHIRDSNGRFRFERLAEDNAVGVLRESLAELNPKGFYTTQDRLDRANQTLDLLNEKLAELHVEARAVLIRAVRFRPEYEEQLQQIQLNEQNKLLDQARERVADKQQSLDNFQQGTLALAAAREQYWAKQLADLERAYQVGFLDTQGDNTPGAARRVMEALTDEDRLALRTQAAQVFGNDDPSTLDMSYLLGIKNIEAETREYAKRVAAEAEGIAARLQAEGDAKVAKVRGEFERQLNALLGSPAGRAYVAWKSAEHVNFEKDLTFNSSDGIPSVLRLRRFAEQFMGR